MHLLLAQKGAINESEEAVDLGQSPGDIVFLSAADTELASLAGALGETGGDTPNLRLANLMQLTHPMSVDVYAENTVAGSLLVVVRVLGGAAYWPYGLEKLHSVATSNGVRLAVLPGDEKPDPGLRQFCTLEEKHCASLHAYLVEGGPQNAKSFLAYCQFLLGKVEEPGEAVPLLKAGIWYPGKGICGSDDLAAQWTEAAPVAAVVFYRALVQSGGLAPVEALVKALRTEGVNALPLFVSSLKDAVSAETVRGHFAQFDPKAVINLTGFAVSQPGGEHQPTVLDETGTPVIQAVLAGGSQESWEASSQGLSARDLAMNVALPEIDGRVLSRAIAFKQADRFDETTQANIVNHQPLRDRVAFTAKLAANWIRLGESPARERKVALVLANYPNRDGRLGNGVGLDTPAGAVELLNGLREQGYDTGTFPGDGNALIEHLMTGPTNAARDGREVREVLPLSDYRSFFDSLPENLRTELGERWGDTESDPFFDPELQGFALPLFVSGNIAIGIQPARGYNIDPKESYHSPDLVPPHGYLAFYAWLRRNFGAHAVIHLGKHGNLEWLPGKALALSENCYPEAVFGPLPHLYPFIVNDPGEGSQAKRRNVAVIIDHLTPPLTRAESYGPLRDLESLVDEYYEASGHDPRRLKLLGRQIFDLVADIGLDADAGIAAGDSEDDKLTKLDAWLCELKELQIRDGLHVFGRSPEGRLLTDLAVALIRLPRGTGEGGNASLHRAIAADLLDRFSPLAGEMSPKVTEGGEAVNIGQTELPPSVVPSGDAPTSPPQGGRVEQVAFDPLDCDMAAEWTSARPELLAGISSDPWRTNGDTVERIELLAQAFVEGRIECPGEWTATSAVLVEVRNNILPMLRGCGERELNGLLTGLDGRFVAPGPSGAPTRGRLDVLPTGRNFYSVDCRAVPTPAAWELGRRSTELLITRYRQDHGDWPTSFGLSAWGTSNMRTGGDDIAQALALIGAKPVWDHASRRVTGYEIMTVAELGRPRVDVTLRISGFFRDAFPAQIELFDKAVRAVGSLEEDDSDNPIAAKMRDEQGELTRSGLDEKQASRRAGYRIFGSKPGAYGAGLQALIDEKGWDDVGDLADAYLAWGSYAYGSVEEGVEDRDQFASRLSGLEAVIHNQDNREHDLLDSDDYYQFEGGMSAAVQHLSGERPAIYHNDHSRPERPVVRALEEEIARIVRGRAANPKWIAGIMRHGYKGAFEMAATLDYMFAFAATTGAVRDRHFDLVHEAWLGEDMVREFIADNNPEALKEMAQRFLEAIERGLWTPRSNSAKFKLEQLAGGERNG